MDIAIPLCAAAFGAIHLRAAWGDIVARDIPNALPLALALLAPAWWWAGGMAPWPAIPIRFGVALLLFALLYLGWARGLIGGGDVKLLAATALWFAPLPLLNLLTIMAIMGGIVTLLTLGWHRLRRPEGMVEVPYGVAIAAAALWTMANGILTDSV